MYYRRANAAVIVYDVSSERSFQEAQEWVKGKLTLNVPIKSFIFLEIRNKIDFPMG